jgi:hypothetical protein
MFMPPRSVRRSSIACLTIAGAMLAVGNLNAHELAGNWPSTAARGRSQGSVGAESTGSLGCEDRRLPRPGSPVRPTDARCCANASTDKVDSPGGPAAQRGLQSGLRVQVNYHIQLGSGVSTGGTRARAGSTLRPGRRPRLRFDAEDWEDRNDEDDDDTDLPVRSAIRAMARCLSDLIPTQAGARFARLEAPSPRFPTRIPLRC